MKVVWTEALVIGGGLAGLRAALGVARRGHAVTVLSLVPPKRSHSAAAQGGMQASLGNTLRGAGDNEDVHFEDTVRGSDWGADQPVVRMFVHTAPKAVRELAAWGVPWNRVRAGAREAVINGERVALEEPAAAQGLIAARNFGGTKKWRTAFVSDGTGHSMLYTVGDRAIAEGIEVLERVEALALIHDGARCYGAIVRSLVTGELVAHVALATCIATGGYGRLYQVTTNAVNSQGMGAAIALDTGVVALGNMEAVQFHPTAIVPAGILVTEGCRGDGGLLRDVDGHRFMPDYEPEKKELASRDVVSRRMEEHMRRGKSVKTRHGDHLWLDITLLGPEHIRKALREVYEICQSFLGIDPTKDWIPVRPAQHYSMGGIRTDPAGHSPHLRGLFACGEAACWDLHGFNRLGGNSVAETVVAGMIVGESIADWCDGEAAGASVPMGLVHEHWEQVDAELAGILGRTGGESALELMEHMQRVMADHVCVFRSGPVLQLALDELQGLLRRSAAIAVRSRAPGANPELVDAYRVRRMLRLALCVVAGALARTESRGAHFREDFPRRDDARWLKRTLAFWRSPDDALPTLAYEPLDVARMELPPGWRGYGSRDHIEHPDTARRAAEVEVIREDAAADRHAAQERLMPFRHLLPPGLRGRNERLDEPFRVAS